MMAALDIKPPWCLTDPAAIEWVHRIYSMTEADGSALVEGLGTPRLDRKGQHGISDNCYAADRLLDWMVDSGWIEPLAYNPSLSQRFFGVGGRAPGRGPRKPFWRASHTYAQEWRFKACLSSVGLNAFVRENVDWSIQPCLRAPRE